MPDTTLLLSFHATGDQENPLEIQFREDLTPMQLSTLITASISMLNGLQEQVDKEANLSRCSQCKNLKEKHKLRYHQVQPICDGCYYSKGPKAVAWRELPPVL